MYKDIFIQRQPVIYQVLKHSIASGQLAHAYLFSGMRGSQMKEAAILLAQSMVCPNGDLFACETCDVCRRVAHHQYTDIIYIDGTDRTIKKEEILQLQRKFMQTALERYNKKVYIIEHADRATPEALNSLLKFLEEPSGEDTTAILISENSDRLLPTILSRCQILSFASSTQQSVYHRAIDMGITPYDSHICSSFIKDEFQIAALVDSENYIQVMDSFHQFLTQASNNFYFAALYMQKEGFNSKNSKGKEFIALFCDIAQVFFKDVIAQNMVGDIWWNDFIMSRRFSAVASSAMRVFAEGKDKLVRNPNLSLLMDEMIFELANIETIAKKEGYRG